MPLKRRLNAADVADTGKTEGRICVLLDSELTGFIIAKGNDLALSRGKSQGLAKRHGEVAAAVIALRQCTGDLVTELRLVATVVLSLREDNCERAQ